MILSGILAILLYLLTSSLLALRLASRLPASWQDRRRIFLILGLTGVVLHGVQVFNSVVSTQGMDTSFFSIMSITGWLVALLLLLASWRKPVENLAILILPIAALSLLLRLLSDHHSHLGEHLPNGLELHIIISIFAYSLLSIAVVQAILLSIQESHLHNRHPGGFIRLLPPLETMETLLFQMISLGFVLLSVALLSGGFFVENLFAQHLVHKTVLSIVAWGLFGILLVGRWRFGWRGRVAIRWTISAFAFLLLAYFGSKMVIEFILQY